MFTRSNISHRTVHVCGYFWIVWHQVLLLQDHQPIGILTSGTLCTRTLFSDCNSIIVTI